MLSSIYYKKILNTILLVVGIFFAFSNQSFAQQVSEEPLFIEGVVDFDVYPYLNQSNPGICVVAGVNASAPTALTFRRVPISSGPITENTIWTTYSNFSSVSQGQTSYSNLASAFGYQPATKYVVELLERSSDGIFHLVTPDDGNDGLTTICTPNTNGTMSQNCPASVPVVTDCSQTGINQALQNFDQNPNTGVTIQNIVPSQSGVTLEVDTQSIESGNLITLLYTTNLSQITGGNFSSVPSAETFYTSNQGPVTLNLIGLQSNTTYYATIIDQAGSVIINTSGNQPYETFTTGTTSSGGNSNGSSGGGAPNPATINVNLQGTFGGADTTGNFTQCGYGETYDCDFNQLLATIDRVIKFAIYVIILPLAAILFAWSGIKLIIAQSKGKSAALSDAKAMFGRVLLGLVFALGAWVIVKFVLVILGYTDASGLLTQILGITTTQ